MADNQHIMTFGERLKFLIQELKEKGVVTGDGKMNSGSFAISIGVDPSQFSRVTKEEIGLTLNQLLKISEIYEVRTGWLLEGEMPVFKVYENETGAAATPDHAVLSKEQLEMVRVSLEKLNQVFSAPPSPSKTKDHPVSQGLGMAERKRVLKGKTDSPVEKGTSNN